jgi:hypothetical protein
MVMTGADDHNMVKSFRCLASLKPSERKTLQPIDQTASIEQSPGKQIFRTGLQIVVDDIRKKADLYDQVIKPFLVDKSNLDQAERITEAK